jgi:uncharacterized membrane protein YedE/YeeE
MFQFAQHYNRRSVSAQIRAAMSSQHNEIHKLLMKMRLVRQIMCGVFIFVFLNFLAMWLTNQPFFLIVSIISFTCGMFLLPCYVVALLESKMVLDRQQKVISISKQQIIDAY